MDKKTYFIGILSLTAVMLLVTNLLLSPPTASGDVAITTTDLQAVTAATNKGGDALYLYDVSSGKLAVFTSEPGKGLTLKAVEDLEQAFEGGNGRRAAKGK